MDSDETVDEVVDEPQVVPLEQAVETGELAEELAELSIGPVKIRELMVEDADDDDPQLLFRDGRPVDTWREGYPYDERLTREVYDRDKRLLQIELLKLQNWIKDTGERVVILFEGRDAAG